MCLIVDNSIAGSFFSNKNGDLLSLAHEWIFNGDGYLVMGGRLWDEYHDLPRGRRIITQRVSLVRELERAGRAIIYSAAAVNEEEAMVKDECWSDDPHIIALARVSGARVLCANDRRLKADFTNPALVNSPVGSVYETSADSSLLRHHAGCPR